MQDRSKPLGKDSIVFAALLLVQGDTPEHAYDMAQVMNHVMVGMPYSEIGFSQLKQLAEAFRAAK